MKTENLEMTIKALENSTKVGDPTLLVATNIGLIALLLSKILDILEEKI